MGHPAIAEAKRLLEVEAASILGVIEHLNDGFVEVVERIGISSPPSGQDARGGGKVKGVEGR